MKIQSETQTRQCPGCRTVMEDQVVTWSNVQVELVSDSAIRADERKKCRAELCHKLGELDADPRGSTVRWATIRQWILREAFGGE